MIVVNFDYKATVAHISRQSLRKKIYITYLQLLVLSKQHLLPQPFLHIDQGSCCKIVQQILPCHA